METIKNNFQYLLIIFASILLSACTSLHWGNIKNDTHNAIKVKLTFSNEHGTRFLETSVKPNSSEIWEYDQSSLVSTKIDKNLVEFEATNSEGCIITFNREAIVEQAKNHKQQIIVKSQDFIDVCGATESINYK